MNKKIVFIVAGVIVLLLAVTGVVVYKAVFSGAPASSQTAEDVIQTDLPAADASIQVDLVKSKTAANTVVVTASGLGGKIAKVSYELQYESKGVGQGVTGQSIDVEGKDTFERDIYLGTCSKNDCTPHLGVTKVTLVLVLTDTSGKQSQFSKDYTL